MNEIRHLKMLIVDDEEALCEMMHLILKDEKCLIDCACSLKEGKEKWQRDIPPIVLLDDYLPDGRGIDMIENNLTLLNNCKVIMITDDDLPSTQKKAKSLGVNYFIQKPLSLKVIKELMDLIVG